MKYAERLQKIHGRDSSRLGKLETRALYVQVEARTSAGNADIERLDAKFDERGLPPTARSNDAKAV